ncbi:anthranilate synthase component [Wallemia mellicola CBS 633.66]|uniref:anthranilate synthase n=1 Tax=Wallemia mellicola (strain ATCC MYA-4683 / CBS 633.66) TaxID=671144 RepID=I4YAK1_WALMC|nr:anthranilate synthase component [Wallemia mellicola CBS 633.66]EIM20993.1 anthranilate synthase component [Wallemia mellicola CBS 633.66]|eukprot:XP_006958982.1 anthranilate synthase component [Wallemia mellicola CBS 633.66]
MSSIYQPSLADVRSLILEQKKGNCVPVYTSIQADLLTPVIAYLKISQNSKYNFLLESVAANERSRYSFIGASPLKVIKSGPNEEITGDPLPALEAELEKYKYVKVDGLDTFTGGAVGYVAYDCVHHFEPKTKRELKDPLGIPESMFMICDTILVFDHIFQKVQVVSHVNVPDNCNEVTIQARYNVAIDKIRQTIELLEDQQIPSVPHQPLIGQSSEAYSNVGKEGYEGFVTSLKEHINKGDIIQAVPSQRLARPTNLHPFNVYRHLRTVNPSPHMFYLDFDGDTPEGVRFVGASPETLCRVENNKVFNHAIAGTVKRGKSKDEDDKLGAELAKSEKDRAEHIMLVDLARNDVNRVCKPETVNVDELMKIEKFSHVIHLTSQISGQLREGKTRFDAFRSIFPAGTVSGAPKVKAMELIGELEGERRGIYAGAAGRFDFADNEMDTCIAIRTMTFKNGVAYLQAGGGIVYDSVEEDEYIETINKLMGNVKCIDQAEDYYRMLNNEI